ncbi:Hsp70 family protein [Streptomyces sp. NPDC127038]|uniref:caspase, EACC1-associated type n=1 Tax=Streptomyces sp. NPDC127038 TaxID=3347114 RepID=UPI00364D7FB2
MRKAALLVVNQHYADGCFDELPGAAADAERLAAVLGDPAIGEFEVTVVENGTAVEIRKAVQSFFAGARGQDLLLLHLSCHGLKDARGRLHFIASDTEKAYLDATAVSSRFVADQLEQSLCRRAVVLLDCCFSGAFTKGMRTRGPAPSVDVAEPFSGRGRVVITSSTALQYSHESGLTSRERAEPSVFTAAVVEGLRDGSADLDGDGYVSVEELYSFVHDRVRSRLPGQTPTRSVDSAVGILHLTRSPGGPRAAAPGGPGLPGTLRAAIHTGAVWQRLGALHEVERLLGDGSGPVREAALEALALLVEDSDPRVGARAERLRRGQGLGEPPPGTPVAASPVTRPVAAGSRILGIDFGTTDSAVAVFLDGRARVLPNRHGELTTPSVVAFAEDGTLLVGRAAKERAARVPGGGIHRIKLELGTGWTHRQGVERHSAEEVASWILADLRRGAEAHLGETADRAVLTVPAHFTHVQRAALAHAAALAGIETVGMLNEPTAAALSYGLGRGEETVMVFDLGGGTLDVSLLGIRDGVVETLATDGDSRLGGSDWDDRIVDRLVRDLAIRRGVRLTDRAALRRVAEAAEAAKIELSQATATTVALPDIAVSPSGPVHLDVTLTRAQLEGLTKDLLERCAQPVRRALEAARGVEGAADVGHFLLVGGATRMPAIAALVGKLAGGREPVRAAVPEGVVIGAALQSAVLTGQSHDELLLDVTSLPLGVETEDGTMAVVVDGDTTIPTERGAVFTTVEDGQSHTEINVYQGSRETAAQNTKLAVLDLPLPPAPRGVPRIEVTFGIGTDNVARLAARDLGTGRELTVLLDRHSAAHALTRDSDPRKTLTRVHGGRPGHGS